MEACDVTDWLSFSSHVVDEKRAYWSHSQKRCGRKHPNTVTRAKSLVRYYFPASIRLFRCSIFKYLIDAINETPRAQPNPDRQHTLILTDGR
ncbi:hypothetical protein MSG28_007956 [Choristoneura fumiferana]|uniref:Uncharacterized protein n=1 Tax=Choristoneura fumiferana TaxID=7141 RepID=A0ACC0J9H4_CHOFU|nr:hypothetical protein MSG28_007956 [Choristoneura fumiferana]